MSERAKGWREQIFRPFTHSLFNPAKVTDFRGLQKTHAGRPGHRSHT